MPGLAPGPPLKRCVVVKDAMVMTGIPAAGGNMMLTGGGGGGGVRRGVVRVCC